MTKTGAGVAGRANPDISVAGRNPVMFDVMHQKPLSWLVTGLSVRLALPVVCFINKVHTRIDAAVSYGRDTADDGSDGFDKGDDNGGDDNGDDNGDDKGGDDKGHNPFVALYAWVSPFAALGHHGAGGENMKGIGGWLG